MRKRMHRQCWRLASLLPGILVLASCASTPDERDVVIDRATPQGVAQVSADNVFDTADSDADGELLPVDIERLGLGGDWHTLDADGSGDVSRQEFRDQFASPLVQTTLRLPGDAELAQPIVSSDFLLPPLPPTQRYAPAPINAFSPTSLATPSDAPLTIPVLINDQEAAELDRAADNARAEGAVSEGADANDIGDDIGSEDADTSNRDVSLPPN
ncbi:hypothetical protein ACUN9V_07765 [Salinicola sp. V024]|uniref:hypothetical protein n=1 Tax=Salinicola sp. V024 TaxID=3459609 RepID=UPI004043E919